MTLILEEMYRVLLKGGKGDRVRYDLTAIVIVLNVVGEVGLLAHTEVLLLMF